MTPYYQDDSVTLYHGDCLNVLPTLPDCSVDAVVTDPPYELGFMGKGWDATGIAYNVAVWRECLRVLKPGGHLLAFGGTRTWHRLAVAVEDAGFEMRDSIAWLYGQGFPKSLNVSKAIESRLTLGKSNSRSLRATEQSGDGAPYALTGRNNGIMGEVRVYDRKEFSPTTPDAERWQGWGTALKPAFEPVVVARKPLQGTVAANVLAHGTGALNIDGCRVGTDGGTFKASKPEGASNGIYGNGINGTVEIGTLNAGRWPANVVLDESQAAKLDEQSGTLTSGALKPYTERHENASSFRMERDKTYEKAADTGGASRFFYVAKAPKSERPRVDGIAHPTVKPLALMRWLVRLVTPPGGTVLEPFAGSGTTAEACVLEGFQCVAIEREADYLPLIVSRLDKPVERAAAELAPYPSMRNE